MNEKPGRFSHIAKSTISRAAFYEPDEILARGYSSFSEGGPEIHIPHGALFYLRLFPAEEQEPLTLKEATDMAMTGMLRPFGRIYKGISYGSNKHGPISYEIIGEQPNVQFSSLTQLFKKNRELWGVDFVLIHSQETRRMLHQDKTKYIPAGYLEEVLSDSVRHYMAFARDFLVLKPPLWLEVGVVGIEGFRLATRETGIMYGTVPPVIHDPEVFSRIEISEIVSDARPIVRPFYRKLWGEAGLEYQ